MENETPDNPPQTWVEPDWAALAEQQWRESCEDPGLDPDDPEVIEAAISRWESDAYDRIP